MASRPSAPRGDRSPGSTLPERHGNFLRAFGGRRRRPSLPNPAAATRPRTRSRRGCVRAHLWRYALDLEPGRLPGHPAPQAPLILKGRDCAHAEPQRAQRAADSRESIESFDSFSLLRALSSSRTAELPNRLARHRHGNHQPHYRAAGGHDHESVPLLEHSGNRRHLHDAHPQWHGGYWNADRPER